MLKIFSLIILLFPHMTWSMPVTAWEETDQAFYFTAEKDQETDLSYLITKPEIVITEIANTGNEKDKIWSRVTLRLKKRSFRDIAQLKMELKNRNFKGHSVQAIKNCQFQSKVKDKLYSLSQATDIKGQRFTGEESRICSFTFAIRKRLGYKRIIKTIKEEIKKGTIIQYQFKPLNFEVIDHVSHQFLLEGIYDALVLKAPKLINGGENALLSLFLWSTEFRNQNDNWDEWLLVAKSDRDKVLGQLFHEMFIEENAEKVTLKKEADVNFEKEIRIRKVIDEVNYEL